MIDLNLSKDLASQVRLFLYKSYGLKQQIVEHGQFTSSLSPNIRIEVKRRYIKTVLE